MAQFEISEAYPNILLVYGTDVYRRVGEDFDVDAGALQAYFSGEVEDSPVSRFSHDFWITHPVITRGSYYLPATVVHEPNPSVPGTFRDFRGIIKMGYDFSTLDSTKAADYFWVLLQEVGHYWLVPNDMIFNGRPIARNLFAEAFMSRNPYPELSLLGRGDDHWSAHIQENPSPLDGADWRIQEEITTEGTRADPNILRKYAQPTTSPNTITVPDVGDVPFGNYPDMDKVIMGVISPEEAYPSEGNAFYELIPAWAAPINMIAGLVLAFSETQVVTFGFLHGITKIGIDQTGTNFNEAWDISSFYMPWRLSSRIIFRVVKKENNYYFQAKEEIGSIGCLGSILRAAGLFTPPPATNPFEASETPSAPISNITDLNTWTTLKVITNTTPPIAVGYGIKTWFPEAWVDMSFKPLMLKTGDTTLPSISTDFATINTTAGSYSSMLRTNTFVFHSPTTNPRLTGDSNSCNITINGNGDNTRNVDNMPKLLVRPPQGNFVAAGSTQIFRSTLAPWSAGAYANVTLWAYRRKIELSGLQLNQQNAFRSTNPGRPYKVAFMIIAPVREEITDTMIANLDKLRLASESVFSTATNNGRTLNTTL